ncbi:MAG: hypothetical protein GPJ54_00050 [Candidatus Heimdallarchaeota archaeon]|nr:hypothetical protein [Candidatus Heimdallarchaeota archaeon]
MEINGGIERITAPITIFMFVLEPLVIWIAVYPTKMRVPVTIIISRLSNMSDKDSNPDISEDRIGRKKVNKRLNSDEYIK